MLRIGIGCIICGICGGGMCVGDAYWICIVLSRRIEDIRVAPRGSYRLGMIPFSIRKLLSELLVMMTAVSIDGEIILTIITVIDSAKESIPIAVSPHDLSHKPINTTRAYAPQAGSATSTRQQAPHNPHRTPP